MQTELSFPPGSDYTYSDLGLILFGAIVELTTGREIEDLAQTTIFSPLKMSVAGYNPPLEWIDRIVPTELDSEGREGLIHGTVHDGNTWFMGGVSPHAGAFALASELGALGQLYLNKGVLHGRRLFRTGTLEAFTRPQEFSDGSESGRAVAWQMASSTAHAGELFSERAFGHTGYTGTSIWIDPEYGLVVVLFTKRVHPTRERGGHGEMRRAFHNEVVKAIMDSEILTLGGAGF